MPNGRRRRPLSLTDRQLEGLAAFVAEYLDDWTERDGMTVPRIREVQAKIDAELDHRDLAGPVIVGRDALIGTPVAVVGPFRRR
jgi:hypothetical protein